MKTTLENGNCGWEIVSRTGFRDWARNTRRKRKWVFQAGIVWNEGRVTPQKWKKFGTLSFLSAVRYPRRSCDWLGKTFLILLVFWELENLTLSFFLLSYTYARVIFFSFFSKKTFFFSKFSLNQILLSKQSPSVEKSWVFLSKVTIL